MEKNIQVRSIGDKVYYLSPKGFSYAIIKSRILNENNSITYRVLSSSSHKEYQGDEVTELELFSNKEELLEHYKRKIHEL